MSAPQIPEGAKVAAGAAVYGALFYRASLNGFECDSVAEVALEAGVRPIVAQALVDEADRVYLPAGSYVHDKRTREILLARADELEAGR